MFILAAYDIADEKRLQRVAKIMQDYGDRVQLSIFEMELDRPAFEKLRRRTESVLDPDEDGVKYFFLCERCAGRVDVLGREAERTPDDGFRVL
jgi:CRISPR-associated protein Cas2